MPLRLLVLLLLAGCGSAGGVSDWERENVKQQDWKEELPPPPAYPRSATLLEFQVGAASSSFRFFIDAATLDPGKDGVVRYVLVARSPSGVDNVTFEGIRCESAEYRRYAIGRPDGSWGGQPGEWRAIEGGRWHRTLQREYFCPQSTPIRDAAEGVRALRAGGHPFATGFDGDAMRERR